jgi:hypothetical protein
VSGGAYRDEAAGLAARLEGLRDDVHRSEKRLPPEVWRYLPVAEAAALQVLRAAVPREMPTTLEAAHLLELALEAYRARLELAIEAARDLEPRIGIAPDSAPELVPRHAFGRVARFIYEFGVSGWRDRIEEAFAGFEAIVTRRFPGARFDSPCHFARRTTVRAHDAPVCLIVEVPPFRGTRGDAVEMRAATHVALAVPRVELSPESMLGHDIEVGDPTFDGLFDVVASPEDARRVLVAEVRAALVRLAWHDVPTVAIGDGHAEIAWTYEPTRDAIEDASRALAALRKLDVDARLLAW